MQKLIPIISDIQEIIRRSDVNLEVSLPTLAVVGSQSTGKSSLLESIIGKDFLPKGKGVVTRRPIEIQLCQIPGDKEYGELVDKKGEHYENMEEFKRVIETETDRMCGGNRGISNVPLRIRFSSKKSLDLMLVDLPGIVKNPSGDQPRDIEEQVVKMIKSYIKNPNCIIIAVSRATDDSANSQSLKLAREIDRDGSRTIGILTQVDLVEENVNILKEYNTLSNKLLLGHTCVFLRPPKSGVTIEEQYKKEEEFFRRHQHYAHCAERMGVRSLVRTLNVLLIKHIKAELPSIREGIILLSEEKKNKIAEYGAYEAITDKKAQGILILALVSKYVKYFVELIEGRYSESRDSVIGGARIQFIFSQVFIKSVNKMNPFEFLSDLDIRTAIRNANGLRKSLFLPEAAFQNLLKTQILRLKLPALECAHLIHEELRRLLYLIRIPEIERYELLSRKIFTVMEDLLGKSLKRTEDMIKSLLEIELGYINTNHPDFIDVISLVKTNPQSKSKLKEEGISSNFEFEAGNQFVSDDPENRHSPPSMFKFNKKVQKHDLSDKTEMIEAKLEHIKNTSEKNKVRRIEGDSSKQVNKPEIQNMYNSFSEISSLPRYELPTVPGVIKVNDKPKPREITETEMIKRLIVSYFNVVKKNINDSIPKTIVTFLVNHCRNSCEKILVSNVYVEEQFEKLLHEQDSIVTEREKLRKDIETLRECLNSINNLDSQLNY